MGYGAVVFGSSILMMCVVLFVVSIHTDKEEAQPKLTFPGAHNPMRRSLEQLLADNKQLRSQVNATAEETKRLRARLRTTMPPGAKLEADLAAPNTHAEDPATLTSSGPGSRPRALAERLRASTEFNQERATTVATNRQILLTFVNRIRLDFADTWVYHVRRLGMTNWLIGATDRASLKSMKTKAYPCFDMRTNLPEGEWPWGSPSFKSLGPHKIELIYKALMWDLEVIITDVDALVLKEPFAFMAPWKDAGFLTTSDHLGNTTNDRGLEDHRGIHTAFNIGYMFFRKSAMPLVEEWRRVIKEDPRSRWDQGEFNRLARTGWKPGRSDGLSDKRLFWSYKNQVIGGVLPISLFCGGHNYFVSQFAQRNGWEPYSIHTTYQYAAAAGKRHRLREAGVWIDPPEYYDPPEGLLSFALEVPREMIYPPGGMTVQGHIALIKLQLRQIRSALALATALGRKLVLPSVVCGYDKYWGPLYRGVIPGTHTWAVPIFNCPLDHFLEVGMLNPVSTVREYSFLTNARTPSSVKGAIRQEQLDLRSVERAAGEVARLRALGAGAKVINVTNSFLHTDLMADASAVLSRQQKRKFTKAFGYTSGSWCCAPNDELKKGAPRSAHFNLLRA